ncbi:hypothetical protein GCM10027020_20500 [Nocardioides salsibiostraticola]
MASMRSVVCRVSRLRPSLVWLLWVASQIPARMNAYGLFMKTICWNMGAGFGFGGAKHSAAWNWPTSKMPM